MKMRVREREREREREGKGEKQSHQPPSENRNYIKVHYTVLKVKKGRRWYDALGNTKSKDGELGGE